MPPYEGGTNSGAPVDWTNAVWNTWTATTTTTRGTSRHASTSGWYETITSGSEWAGEPEPEETPEERAERLARERREREARDRRQQREYRERIARLDAAKARAEELLRLVLLPDELERYDATGSIEVTGSDGRRYQIDEGVVSNVYALDNDRLRIAALCCHPDLFPGVAPGSSLPGDAPPDRLPYADVHASQVLQLRHDAPAFWDKANIDWFDRDAQMQYQEQLIHRDRVQRRERQRRAGGRLAA